MLASVFYDTRIQIWMMTILIVLLPFLLKFLGRFGERAERIGCCLLSILFFALAIYFKSRSGIISLFACGVVYVYPLLQKRFGKCKVIGGLCLLTIVVSASLYSVRPESAAGRLLVYKVITRAICNQPLVGYGSHAMYQHYMFHQAEYFQARPADSAAQLADNVYFPYNEFLGIAYRFGLPVLIVTIMLLIWMYMRSGTVVRVSLAGLLTMCMFSYPFSAISMQASKIETLYEEAASLNLNGRYHESDSVLITCQKYFNNYDTELLAADNALQQEKYKQAIPHLVMAHNMIPNRFYPLYGLMLCYEEVFPSKAYCVAQEIRQKEIKVPSPDVDMIRAEAASYIKENKPCAQKEQSY